MRSDSLQLKSAHGGFALSGVCRLGRLPHIIRCISCQDWSRREYRLVLCCAGFSFYIYAGSYRYRCRPLGAGSKMLSLCHVLAGGFMCAAGWYAINSPAVEFAPLFTLYTMSVAFFMPTIGLSNSVSYAALNKYGLDPVKHFPPVRVFGTVGFIIAMLFVSTLQAFRILHSIEPADILALTNLGEICT